MLGWEIRIIYQHLKFQKLLFGILQNNKRNGKLGGKATFPVHFLLIIFVSLSVWHCGGFENIKNFWFLLSQNLCNAKFFYLFKLMFSQIVKSTFSDYINLIF